MADVSGKGVPAALFMMVSKAILKNLAMVGKSAGEILTAMNETICKNNRMEMFVTVWLGILEISTGRIVAANAGHEYPAISGDGGCFELRKGRHDFVVGGMEGGDQRGSGTLRNGPHDRRLNRCARRSPKEILNGVRESVDAFVGDGEQFDDMTMLCLEYKGPEQQHAGETAQPEAAARRLES